MLKRRNQDADASYVYVYDRPCFGCPFTPTSIVGPARLKQIHEDCAKRDVHFTCHKVNTGSAAPVPRFLLCAGYFKAIYKKLGHGKMAAIAERLGLLRVIPIPKALDDEAKKTLMPWRKMEKR